MPRRTPSVTLIALLPLVALLFASPESLPAQRRAARKGANAPAAPAAARPDSTWTQLHFRHIGPEGNRVTSVSGVAGDPMTYYAGAASGGLWKSGDGGVHWEPLTDTLPVSSIGSVAVAPSDPNTVWIGTGEPFIRSHISVGWGMWKTTDGGKSWTKSGLDATGRISRIVIDPHDPNRVYVAALGHAYGPQPERGIFRTTDGGKSWSRVLFVNDSTGASDLVMDPNNPRILFAGMWQIEIHTWGRTSGGAGSGIWMSRDGGDTWTRITGHGLPEKPLGKIGLAMSKANSNRVYALIETGDGVPAVNVAQPAQGRLFRSDDGGTTWQLVSSDRQLAGRTHYYNRMAAEPDNADEAVFATANWAKTLDGGKTIIDPPEAQIPGGDHHDIWIDPTNGNRMIVSHDGGISITENRGRSWMQIELPIAQIYHATTDNRVPYDVYGNRQDGPSSMGPSNSRIAGTYDDLGITRGMWRTVGGGESGWATPDPVDTNLVWSTASGYGSMGGIVTRYDTRNAQIRTVEVWPKMTVGWPADSLRYRFVWTFPLTISPHDHNTVYVGSQHVHVTTDGGQSWKEISPDLTRNDKSRQKPSGGLTPDNIGVEYAGVVFAIAESPKEKGTIWAGTNDGLVHVTRDGGKTWTNVTANIPGLVNWGTISNIEPSHYDAGTAYLTVDAHQVNNRDPWVYRTTDYGKTWKLITNGLAKTPVSYAHIVKEDPARRGLLYLGTEGGLYVSFDDGANWQPFQNNLPHAPVYGITVQEHFNDLVLATYGRGMWILDDITPLRQTTADVMAKNAYLYAPRMAYRFRDVEPPYAKGNDPVAGKNPPYGASLHYWIKAVKKDSAGKDKADSVTFTFADQNGAVVRTMKAPVKAGVNRAWWDLRADRTKEAKLRTSPEYAPWFPVSIEGRTAPGIGRFAMLVPPGRYTVKMSYDGASFTQPLDVIKDPNSAGSAQDVAAEVAMASALRADIDEAVGMIDNLELVRGQLGTLKTVLATDSTRKDLQTAADSLDAKALAAERRLFQTRVTGRGQDLIRWPTRVTERLIYLAASVDGSDFPPTDAQKQVQGELHTELQSIRTQVDQLVSRDLAAFNDLLRSKNVRNVIVLGGQ